MTYDEYKKAIYKTAIDAIIFQLKCIKEHLKFVSKTTDKSVDFDIAVLDEACISQLEGLKNIF